MKTLHDKLIGAALVLAVGLINFLTMPGEFWGGDPVAWREEARSILLERRLDVPEQSATAFGQPGQYFVKNPSNGRYYMKFGLMNSLMSVPPMWVQKQFGIGLGGSAAIEKRLAKPSLLLFNLWNIVLGMTVACLLWIITGWYSNRWFTRVLFVLISLYCTFLAYYQRAQSSEIYQVLFFLGFFSSFMCFARNQNRIALTLSWIFVSLLVFTRVSYGLLLPLTIVLAAFPIWRKGTLLRTAPAIFIPPLLILLALGYVNYIRFGSPWLSGYHAWQPERHMLVGRLQDGVWGLLFAPRFSILLYFPPLIFSLLAWKSFAQKHRLDAIVIGSTFIVFLLCIGKIPTWHGEWTYGPRYLLFILPVLSIPFMPMFDRLIEQMHRWPARGVVVLVGIVLGYSMCLQVQVNRLPFWIYYQARAPLDAVTSDGMQTYFRDHHVGVIADDLLWYRDDPEKLPYWSDLSRLLAPQSMQYYRDQLQKSVKGGNWYWSLPAEARG